jgi:putative protease
VANITKHYRRANDQALQGRPINFSRDDVREMELSFSRGFSPGWLRGDDHKMLVPALSSAKRGIKLGTITRVLDRSVLVRLNGPVKRGDGIVFEGDREANDEQGGRIFNVLRHGMRLDETTSDGVVELEFQRNVIDFGRLLVGQTIWKTDDPQLTARLRKSFTGPDPIRKRSLAISVRAVAGEPLIIDARLKSVEPSDFAALNAQVSSDEPLAIARKHPATVEFFREQLSRLGGSAYELTEINAEIVGGPMVPLSVLSGLRQELIGKLNSFATIRSERRMYVGSALDAIRELAKQESARPVDDLLSPRLHLLCRTLEQVKAVAENVHQEKTPEESLICADFQDIREYREAVSIAHSSGRKIYLAPPRIQKPDEAGLFVALRKYEANGMLVRNLAGMRFCCEHQIPFITDYSLNATNELTVQYLIEQGARRVTASYDLNRDQLLDLVSAVPASRLEVVIHQHMPMFHMEHCVFCAVLSPGTNKTNCGRPCDTHLVQLRDRVGCEHPLKADVGCRNTLYNSVPQSAAEVVPQLLLNGVRDLRIEFLDERPDETRRTIQLYRDLLSAKLTGEEIWKRLKAANRVGVTRGTLEERRNPLAIL